MDSRVRRVGSTQENGSESCQDVLHSLYFFSEDKGIK